MRALDVIQTGPEILALLFLWSTVAIAQSQKPEPPQQPSILKVVVDLVSLRVAVTDQKGRVVTGLKKEDLKVYENKIEQSISFFSTEETPVSWGLVLDRSGSMMGMMRDVYQAALHVIDEGTEEDEIFVVTFTDQMEILCDFTTDRHKLENSILGLHASGETALYDAVAFPLDRVQRGKHQKKVLGGYHRRRGQQQPAQVPQVD